MTTSTFAALALWLLLLAPTALAASAAAPTTAPPAARAMAERDVAAGVRAVDELQRAGRVREGWALAAAQLPLQLAAVAQESRAAPDAQPGTPPGADAEAARIAAQQLSRAALEVAARQWGALTEELDAWPEAAALLAALPADAWQAAPPVTAALLRQTQAAALRATGQIAAARARSAESGFVTDWWLIGPFDNERGRGFGVEHGPERAIDLESPLPGREREVHWRRNPVPDHPLGALHLHNVLRPARQVAACLATALVSDAGGPAVAVLSVTGAWRLRLNGVELAARNLEHRPAAPDQDRVLLPLQAGVNQLLLTAAVQDDTWTLALRLTDLHGAPLPELRVDSALVATPDEALRAATAAALEAAPDPSATPTPHAGSQLAALPDDPVAQRLLALWHLLAVPDDRSERSARRAAQRAVALDGEDLFGLDLLARAEAPFGESRLQMALNPRLHALQAVLDRQPEHVGALLDLAAISAELVVLPERFDRSTAAALAAAPESFATHQARAQYLSARGREVEADLLRRQAAALPEAQWRQAGALQRAAESSVAGRPDEARAILSAAFARRSLDGPVLDALLARAADLGLADEVAALTRSALEAEPFGIARMGRSARLLEVLERVDTARELLDRALAICPEHAELLAARSRVAERQGDIDTGLADLARAVELDPGNAPLAQRLELLRAGEEVERFETPWRTDATAWLGTPLPDADEPLECLERTTVWRVHADGAGHRYEHLVLRPLGPGGVRALSDWRLHADGGTLRVQSMRVIRADGRIEHAPPARGARRHYEFPALSPGDLVDIEYRVDRRADAVFGDYFGLRHVFHAEVRGSAVPTRRSRLVVLAPPERPLHVAERGGEALQRSEELRSDGLLVREWLATDLPRPPVESAMPALIEQVPLVDLTTFRDWDAMARWWWSFIEKEFTLTPAMQVKVAELTDGLPDEAARIAAIARFVGQEIRYNSWPFGTHGYEPFSAATIFERRFGDCKDKSILLATLLAEIGVQAVPVLIKAEYARPHEPLEAALIEHFNHCIAWVEPEGDRPGFYLDATADRNPVEYLRADDQGARVLHVTPQGGELRDIPFAPPQENRLQRDWRVALASDGSGQVTLRDESNGSYAVRLRTRYGGEPGARAALLAAELAETFGPVTVQSVEVPDLEDITRPAWLAAEFRADGLSIAQSSGQLLATGFDGVGLAGIATEAPHARSQDVVLDRPFSQRSRVTWLLPPGTEPGPLPADVEIEAPGLLSYRQSARTVEGGVEVERAFDLFVQRVPVADYESFRTALQEVRLAESRRLNFRMTPEGVEVR